MISSIINAFNQIPNSSNYDARKLAAFCINELMATTQSTRHLENTLDRITLTMGEAPGRNHGMQLINSVVAGTVFSDCVQQCTVQVAQASPLMGRPFLRNDEPEFQIAQFPLHHPGYLLA
jgi:hypothetical protein